MDELTWTGVEEELATEQDQIPPPGTGNRALLRGSATVGI